MTEGDEDKEGAIHEMLVGTEIEEEEIQNCVP